MAYNCLYWFIWVYRGAILESTPSGFIKHGCQREIMVNGRFSVRKLTDFYGPFPSQACLMTPEGMREIPMVKGGLQLRGSPN